MLRIEVWNKPAFPDPRAEGLKKDISDLGISGIEHIDISDVYSLTGDLNQDDADRICREVLVDPIVQDYHSEMTTVIPQQINGFSVEVAYNPGVMDPIEFSLRKAITDLGIDKVNTIKTGNKYVLRGNVSKNDLQSIVNKLLLNPVIQHAVTSQEQIDADAHDYQFRLTTVDLIGIDDDELESIGSHKLSLNLEEMKQKAVGMGNTKEALEWSKEIHKVSQLYVQKLEIEAKNIEGINITIKKDKDE